MQQVLLLSLLSAAMVSVADRVEGLEGLVLLAFVPLAHSLVRQYSPLRSALATAVAASPIFIIGFEGVLPLAPWLYPALVLSQTLLYALPGFVTALALRRWGSRYGLLVLPVSWVATEYIHSNTTLWGHWANPGSLGYFSFGTPLMQSAAVSGITGVTFLILMVNVALYLLVRMREYRPALVVTLFLVSAAFTSRPISDNLPTPPLKVTIVQGALTEFEMLAYQFDEDAQGLAYKKYSDLTQAAVELHHPDLVVWPESSVPVNVYPHWVDPRFTEVLKTTPTLIAGGYFKDETGYFNAAFVWNQHALDVAYRKRFTAPIAEDKFTQGERQFPVDVAGIKAGIAICYDGAFPEHSRQAVQDGANLLIVVTNDTWAGSTSAPFWHLKASAFRAIETGRYIIHASQSGPSAIITGSGKILEATSRGQATALTNSVIPHYTQTLYVRLGNWIGLLCFGTTVIMLILTLKKEIEPSRKVEERRA